METKEQAQHNTYEGLRLYRLSEAGRILGVSDATIYRWIKKGKIKYVTINGRRYIPEFAFKELIMQNLKVNNQKEASHGAGK